MVYGMDTQDKRFLAAVLGDGRQTSSPLDRQALGNPGIGGFTLGNALEWPFAPHAGIRSLFIYYRRDGPPYERLVLTACWGGDITGTELSVGLDLALEPMDTGDVFGKSEDLIGQLVSPETAPATRNTVQLDFTERLTPGTASFGLAKLRARILWQAIATSFGFTARCRRAGPSRRTSRRTRAPSRAEPRTSIPPPGDTPIPASCSGFPSSPRTAAKSST